MKGKEKFDAGPSKILSRKWKEHEAELHRKKLNNVKSSISQSKQRPYAHKHPSLLAAKRAKREVIAEERYTEIERENRILLEKMSNIMQKQKPSLYRPPETQVMMKRSLNRNRRKIEFEKITLENDKILKRLQKKTATYSVERWDKDFAQQKKYRDIKSENPYEFGKGQETSIMQRHRLSTATDSQGLRHRGSTIDYSNNENTSLPRIGTGGESSQRGYRSKFDQNTNLRNTLNSQNNSNMRTNNFEIPIINQAEHLHEQRVILFKKRKNLGNGIFVVEISTHDGNLCIAAFDTKTPESLLIELADGRSQHILNEFKNDYELMSSNLQVQKKRLILLNPKYKPQPSVFDQEVVEDLQENQPQPIQEEPNDVEQGSQPDQNQFGQMVQQDEKQESQSIKMQQQ